MKKKKSIAKNSKQASRAPRGSAFRALLTSSSPSLLSLVAIIAIVAIVALAVPRSSGSGETILGHTFYMFENDQQAINDAKARTNAYFQNYRERQRTLRNSPGPLRNLERTHQIYVDSCARYGGLLDIELDDPLFCRKVESAFSSTDVLIAQGLLIRGSSTPVSVYANLQNCHPQLAEFLLGVAPDHILDVKAQAEARCAPTEVATTTETETVVTTGSGNTGVFSATFTTQPAAPVCPAVDEGCSEEGVYSFKQCTAQGCAQAFVCTLESGALVWKEVIVPDLVSSSGGALGAVMCPDGMVFSGGTCVPLQQAAGGVAEPANNNNSNGTNGSNSAHALALPVSPRPVPRVEAGFAPSLAVADALDIDFVRSGELIETVWYDDGGISSIPAAGNTDIRVRFTGSQNIKTLSSVDAADVRFTVYAVDATLYRRITDCAQPLQGSPVSSATINAHPAGTESTYCIMTAEGYVSEVTFKHDRDFMSPLTIKYTLTCTDGNCGDSTYEVQFS